MEKKLLWGFAGICLAATGIAYASNAGYEFPCPTPSQLTLTPNNAVLYAPNPTSGMPSNLVGDSGLGVNAAWSGLILGYSFQQVTNITFETVYLPKTDGNVYAVYCIYDLTGTDTKNQPAYTTVYTTPGNSNYLNMYKYTLNNGQDYSHDNSTLIVATDPSQVK